jgi:LAGLIDADG DNA endonuclease family
LGYTLGLKRYTPLIRSMVQIPYYQLSVIIGLLLSDGSININTGKGLNRAKLNARIEFTQSFDKFPYFWSVFNALSHFCAGLPKEAVRKRNGITNYSIRFCSRAFPCLTELHKLFYINGVKVIPVDIFNMLTPIALAH